MKISCIALYFWKGSLFLSIIYHARLFCCVNCAVDMMIVSWILFFWTKGIKPNLDIEEEKWDDSSPNPFSKPYQLSGVSNINGKWSMCPHHIQRFAILGQKQLRETPVFHYVSSHAAAAHGVCVFGQTIRKLEWIEMNGAESASGRAEKLDVSAIAIGRFFAWFTAPN